MAEISAIVTTLDNLPILREQVRVLKNDSCVSKIVVVSNGSIDGTNEWLDEQCGLVVVKRENKGAGPGRNAGLDAAGEANYYLMLDGGILPLIDGTEKMLAYLERCQDADLIGVEIADFETDRSKAWRRWPNPILDEHTYRNTRLSHTAYCLTRFKCFDGKRFCEEGPFSSVAWGCDDDEMAYQWNDAGIVIHVVTCQCRHGKSCTGVHPYRRGSGSFRRIFKETGVWANQHGSGYEQRLVWLQQNWPQYQPGVVWGEPWLTVVVEATDVGTTAGVVKHAHDRLRQRRFGPPYDRAWNPYSVVVWHNGDKDILTWAEHQSLRQHHGDTTIINGAIVKRDNGNETAWTGDFRMWDSSDWHTAIRCNYYGQARTVTDVDVLLDVYDKVYPRRSDNVPPGIEPTELTEEVTNG